MEKSVEAIYAAVLGDFMTKGLAIAQFQSNPDYFVQGAAVRGTAFSVATPDFHECSKGAKLLNRYVAERRALDAILPQDAVTWMNPSDLHISIYFTKKPLAIGDGARCMDAHTLDAIRRICANVGPVSLTLDRLLIDRNGSIMLAGFSGELERLRERLDAALGGMFPQGWRPSIINCTLARITCELQDQVQERTRLYLAKNSRLESIQLQMSSLRYARSVGTIYQLTLQDLARLPLAV